MSHYMEVDLGPQSMQIDLRAVVAIQQRGDNYIVHTQGGPIQVTREVAAAIRPEWRRFMKAGGSDR